MAVPAIPEPSLQTARFKLPARCRGSLLGTFASVLLAPAEISTASVGRTLLFAAVDLESAYSLKQQPFFCSYDRPGVCAQRGAVNPRSPGGVSEAKRGAAFYAAGSRVAGQGLTGGAERSAIVAGRKDKSGPIDRGAAKRSDVPLVLLFPATETIRKERRRLGRVMHRNIAPACPESVLFGNPASETKAKTAPRYAVLVCR